MADQPAALRPMLRKAITGNPEPFEVEQQLKAEKLLGETSVKPSYKEQTPSVQEDPAYQKLEATNKANLADKTKLEDKMKLDAQKTPTDLMKNESDIIS